MKTKFLHRLALLAFLQVAVTISVMAQEGMPNPELNTVYPDNSVYDDKPLLLESESRNAKIVRDTVAQPKTPATKGKPAASNSTTTDVRKSAPGRGDDPLNFNFLYYIIQKFKTSDLIDE